MNSSVAGGSHFWTAGTKVILQWQEGKYLHPIHSNVCITLDSGAKMMEF